MRYNSLLELIGDTPLVKLNNTPSEAEVFAKLEKFNPGGSIKDRIARSMIEDAERKGALDKGKIVVEPTSGNTGIGLALVCLLKGYELILIMPDTMSVERRQILMALGAKIIMTEGSKGMNGAEDFAKELVSSRPDKYFMPDQFSNHSNPLAHYQTTAEEILRDTQGRITHLVAGMGTTGTIVGISKRLKEHDPRIKVIGVQPNPKTPIQGLKNLDISYVPKIWNKAAVDEIRHISLSEAEDASRELTLREGIFSGISTGAAYRVAMDVAKEIGSGIIVFIAPDGGEKYLSTMLCDPGKCLECVGRFGLKCAYSDGKPLMKAAEVRDEMMSHGL
jgi:cysteine synthase